MSAITRRGFLRTSCAAMGASALCNPLVAGPTTGDENDAGAPRVARANVYSMLGDFAVDTYNNTSMVQHCEGPWNAWGDERRVPYILTDHRERPVRQRGKVGVSAASWILYPPDEPVTMWQIDVESKKVLLHTGKTVPMLTTAARYRDHMYEMM